MKTTGIVGPPTPPPIDRNASVLAIVPHFACEQWLADCITSLLNQTRPPDGIVVVDDASPSPPVEIVAEFPDVTLLTAASNVGPYMLVQQVIETTRYDAYMFQDADDWSADDRLACLLEAAEQTGAELVGSDYVMVQCDQGSAWVQGFPHDVNASLAAAPTAHALQHPTSLVARSLVERLGGFASGMRFSGDAEFLRRAVLAGRVINVTRPLYFRRNRSDSLTTSAATGHGSLARKAVLDALAERAWENAGAVARGESPSLEPFSWRDPVDLVHLSGPLLGQQQASVRARPARTVSGRRPPTAETPRSPVFVVSAVPSLPDALIWSLAQHPDVAAAPQASWITPLAQAADQAHAVPGHGTAIPRTGRAMGALDSVGATRSDLLDAVASMVDGIVGRNVGAWVASLPAEADDIAAAAALFPGSRLIHVIRHVDDAGSEADEWLSSMWTCLDAEQRFGHERVLRVLFDDLVENSETAMRSCLAFVDVHYDERCTWPLRSFILPSPAATGEQPELVTDPLRVARALSIALCGPRPAPPTDERRLTLGALQTAATPTPSGPSLPARGPLLAPSALLHAALPADVIVAVVSKGDDQLIDIPQATGWHFPQLDDGRWAGYHPKSSQDVIAHLEEMQRQGAEYFFVPAWAMWWLDHYAAFREHLEGLARIVAFSPEGGLLLHLGTTARATDRLDLSRLVPEDQRRLLYQKLEAGGADAPTASPALPSLTELVPERPARRRHGTSLAVISWSVSHNPLGRAYLLADVLGRQYDVELLGARFEQFGEGVWPPLRDSAIPVRSFQGGPFPEHFWRMEQIAAQIDADVLVVCKPRLPSLDIGILAKAVRNRPVLLDIDDRELTFVRAKEGVSLDHVAAHATNPALLNPFGRLWTQYCETLIPHADELIVSNAALQGLYGGVLVPHARDEQVFDPARIGRTEARAAYGFAEHERIVLFAGTPRRHKGIGQILHALAEIGDPRNKLCVIGTREYEEQRDELAGFEQWLRVLPYQRFDELPRLLAASDVVCVLQDPGDPVSHFQIPAKVTDALAMGVPCIVSPVEPLAEVIAAGGVLTHGEVSLASTLRSVLADRDGARLVAERGREYFLQRLSYGSVLPQLAAVIDGLSAGTPTMPAEFDRLISFQRDTFGRQPVPPPAVLPRLLDAAPARTAPFTAPPAVPFERVATSTEPLYDIALFWKQNDTGIYGRRHDMLLRELVASPKVGNIVQFDAPVDLAAPRPSGRVDIPTQDDLIQQRLVSRLRGVQAAPGLMQYTFGYNDNDGDTWHESYIEYVRTAIAEHCSSSRELVFWMYPKNFELPGLIQAVEPDLVLADIVDDHRSWARPGSERWRMIDRHYAEIASLSDVLVSNCESMAQMMSSFGKRVHVVPNGCEYPMQLPDHSVPTDLLHLPRPIIGYLGNLSSRLDLQLLERLATELPAASVVLVGSAHAGPDVLILDRFDNVHILGPRPYDEAKRYAAAFDVGIIPHVDNEMTRAMNPLKAFVYAAVGTPAVSTRVANLDEMGDLITIADGHASFVDAVRRAATGGKLSHTPAQRERLEANTWSRRMERFMTLLDAVRLATPAPVGGPQ